LPNPTQPSFSAPPLFSSSPYSFFFSASIMYPFLFPSIHLCPSFPPLYSVFSTHPCHKSAPNPAKGSGLDWIERGLTSHSRHFRSFQRRWVSRNAASSLAGRGQSQYHNSISVFYFEPRKRVRCL